MQKSIDEIKLKVLSVAVQIKTHLLFIESHKIHFFAFHSNFIFANVIINVHAIGRIE